MDIENHESFDGSLDLETKADALESSFDLAARQEAHDAALAMLRGEVDEVKSRLDRVYRTGAARPMLGAGDAAPEVKGFIDGYIRSGRETELKSLSTAVAVDGGYAVPRQIDELIARRLVKISPVRSVASVVQTSTSGFRRLISTGGTASGWVSETAARPDSASPKLAEIVPPMGELYANPSATQAMLDDAAFDVENWLAGEIATEFARAEGAAFINGTGTNQPKGFLQAGSATTGDTVRAYGTLQHVVSGNATGFDTAPDSKLIDMVFSLRAGLRQGAVWMMNSATLAAVRKFKAPDGSFLWQPGIVDGQPNRLLGYPVMEAEDMPDIGAGAFPVAFGNFKAGYLITERAATTILRDPYTNKPYVQFYATRRIGGQVLDSDAIKLLKIST
ncbi:phage major capsid protein [Novosphingobium sp. KCTC 2891]|uniref:phage major capsid protein n=1 Tax=Novosphingobium sp. KCTC 2891 TaxID=2989730 RepID=UPI0022239C70|nr:phage major capsid protein [Novosphingobium sp. KCTC 2891]MCW1383209.1 phage major capsid protein [Novosphingobium sp. KCTC 2891]